MTPEAIESKYKLSKADYEELLVLNTKMNMILEKYGHNPDNSYYSSLDRLKNTVANTSEVLTYVSRER